MKPSVTVVVPVFNGAAHLREMIRSVLAQTTTGFRFVCIDDASTDGSAGIAEEEGVEVLRNPARLGLAGNWNRAVEVSDTAYLVIAHQDDVYDPRFLETMAPLIEAHPRALIAHSRVQYVDEHGRPMDSAAARFKETFWPPEDPYERDGADEMTALLRGNYIICPATIFRREAMDRIGRFNERYRFVTDWEYWMRGVLAGASVAGTASRLLGWRRHSGTATASHALMLSRFEEEIALLEWAGGMARSRGYDVPRGRQFEPVRNTILDEFVTRLSAGDTGGARELIAFAEQRFPRDANRGWIVALKAALRGGRIAGRALAVAERAYVSFASRARR